MPLRPEPFRAIACRNFFAKLLPEDNIEIALTRYQQHSSMFSFLEEFGLDCA